MIDKSILLKIEHVEKELSGKLEYMSNFLYKNPELGMEEYIAAKVICDVIKDYGFTVIKPFCGFDTGFLAEFDNGDGPKIALIAEYDALPGFGPDNGPGHACGHNWITAVSLGAAIVLSFLKDEFKGKVQLIGTPGMENYGSKVDFINQHVFDDVDIVIQPHLEKYTSVSCQSFALDAIEFSFKGRATHAAVYPEEGINALDAVQFTFAGINALKNYFKAGVNLHGIISDGGEAPSIVPEHAACKFYLRAKDRKYLDTIKPRIIQCAEGAALMTGSEMSYQYFENSLDNIINNKVLQELAKSYLKLEDIIPSEEYDLASTFPSTDIGNVSHICPTLYMEFDLAPDGEFRIHDNTAMKYVNSKYSNRRLHQVVRIICGLSIELFNNPKLLEEIKISHRKTMSQ
ncbi:MAG: amidohydrolase [Anaerovorax sp.]|nr:amidohydrolase [Anaerovorax sp.]